MEGSKSVKALANKKALSLWKLWLIEGSKSVEASMLTLTCHVANLLV